MPQILGAVAAITLAQAIDLNVTDSGKTYRIPPDDAC